MIFFSVIGLIYVFYYLICLVLWIALDSDAELFFKSLFGKRISKNNDLPERL